MGKESKGVLYQAGQMFNPEAAFMWMLVNTVRKDLGMPHFSVQDIIGKNQLELAQ
jgi:hypothetical protein